MTLPPRSPAPASPPPPAARAADPNDLSVEAALLRGTDFLKKMGIEAARLEMELILARALGMDRLRLYLSLKNPLPPEARDASRAMLARRREREPLAYILGAREFYGLKFEVAPAALIPRPETELLVDRAIKWAQAWIAERPDRAEGPAIVDIGAGSGAIAVAVAHALAKKTLPFRMTATDISADALALARRNAEAHGVAERIDFREGAFYAPLEAAVDLICANPPYIADAEREALAPEISNWEPATALFSGAEGLDHLRELIAGAAEKLEPAGAMMLEIGYGQGEKVEALLRAAPGLEFVAIHPDLAGIPRIAEARRME